MATVTVIGAGVGGLATAARLAAAGHKVTVFEQAATAGGKLGRHERVTDAGTFRFDTGPSLFTLPQVAAELFAHTGGPAPELDLVALDPLVRHRFPDGTTLDSCAGAGFEERIAATFGAGAADDWRRLWQRAARVWETSWRHVLTAPVDNPLQLAGLAWRLRDLAAIAPGQTLRGLGRRHLRDPRLRMLLDRYATYTGADPRRAPAALLAIPYAELAFGGWYIRGGLGTLADALLARCAALGVTVHLGTPVESVLVEGPRAAGVVLAGGTVVRSDLVVANADALHVYRDLLPSPRRAAGLRRRSLGGFVLLLGVRGTTPDLAHHTVFFPRDYDAEFDAIFGTPARPPDDPAVFVTAADDPAARPAGHEAWFVLVNAPPHGDSGNLASRSPGGSSQASFSSSRASGAFSRDSSSSSQASGSASRGSGSSSQGSGSSSQGSGSVSRGSGDFDWRAPGVADAYADHVLSILAARGADVRDRLLFRDVLTPADLETSTHSPGGAIYGTASHGLTGLLRPPTRGAVRDLFLVGGSVHPGGGLPLVMLSAKIVADRIGPA